MIYKQKMGHSRHTNLKYGFMNVACQDAHTCICEGHRLTTMGKPKSPDCDQPTMSPDKVFTPEKAKEIGEALGVDWTEFDVEQFRVGMDVELEHGTRDPSTNVTDDDPLKTGKIALAHLNEFPDYYTRLLELEEEAEKYWDEKKD